MRRKLLGDEHPYVAANLHNLATMLDAKGDWPAAEPLHREALAMSRKLLGDEHPHVVRNLHNLAWLLHTKGEYAEAERMFREALALAERLRTRIVGEERGRAAYAGKLGLSGIAARYASLLIETGRSTEAWSISERGRGRALLDLLARDDRDLPEQARAMVEQTGDAKVVAALETALNREQQAQVDLTTAEALLAGVRKQRKHIEGREDLSDDEKIARLTGLDQQIVEQTETVKFKRRALADAGAKVLMKMRGLFPDAQPMSIERIRAGLQPGELALGYTWTSESVLLLAAPSNGHGEVQGLSLARTEEEVEELATLVRQVRDSISARSPAPVADVDTVAAEKLLAVLVPDSIRRQVQIADRLIVLPDGPLHDVPFEVLASGDGASPESFRLDDRQVVYAASATMYLNRREVARRKVGTGAHTAVVLGDPVFDREPGPEPDYPKQGVLLSMVASNSNAAKVGLTRGDVLLSYGGKQTPSPESLGPAISAVNEAIDSGTREADAPVKVSFWRGGETKEATLLPGPMGIRPSQGNPADGLRSMARMARGFEQATAELSATDQVRLFGDRLSSLPGTAREAKAIAALFTRSKGHSSKARRGTDPKSAKDGGEVVLLLGEDSTAGKLQSSVSGKRYLHLATHGLTGSVGRPYDASLALTQPKMVTSDDIGFLRLGDLIRTWRGKLEDCELVVLSACDTQRGIRKGTGIMALPWGFMYAGAPTVVASLWKVDDTATALLMIRFYENLLGEFKEPRELPNRIYASGEAIPKADALREAKVWLRGLSADQLGTLCDTHGLPKPGSIVRGTPGRMGSETSPEHPFGHPYYWSSFILIGDPG